MKEHSKEAWEIASRYSAVLASETRDLAAHIDKALQAERERCAEVACNRLKAISDGIRGPKNYIPLAIIADVKAIVLLPPQPDDPGQ